MHRHLFFSTRHAPAARLFSTAITPPLRSRVIRATTLTAVVGLGAYYFFAPSPSRHAITSSSLPLDISHFTPVTVESSEDSGPSTKLITLALDPRLVPALKPDQVVHSIFIKDDDIQVERPFTPLYGIPEDGKMRLWVKRYESGEVGRWLHSKKVREVIEIRGPAPTWDYSTELSSGKWDEVIMISGGTGITPFFQLVHSRFISPSTTSHKPRFTLLHSSPTPSQLPPPEILTPLQSLSTSHPSSFSLHLFVDQKGPGPSATPHRISKPDIESLVSSRIKAPWYAFWKEGSTSPDSKSPLSRTLVLVCGPEPMLNALAGPRARGPVDGDKPAGGVLGALGFTAGQVRRF